MNLMVCTTCQRLVILNATGICLGCQRGFINLPQEDSFEEKGKNEITTKKPQSEKKNTYGKKSSRATKKN